MRIEWPARMTEQLAAWFPAHSLRKRFAEGALWVLAGNMASSALQLGAFLAAARVLGRTSFGALGILTSTVQTLGVFAGLGLGLTATKYVAEFRQTNPARAGRIVAVTTAASAIAGGTVALALCVASPWLAGHALAAPQLANDLRLAAGLLLFSTLMNVQNGTLAGLESFATLARVNLVRGLLNFPAALAGAWLFGLPGTVVGLLAGAAAGWWVSQREVRRACLRAGIDVAYSALWTEFGPLRDFSVPGFLGGVAVFAVSWLGNVLLVRGPQGYAEMGVFNAANQWRMALLFLPGVVSQSSLPILANLYGASDWVRYRRMLTGLLVLVTLASVLCAAPVAGCATWILRGYGGEFSSGRLALVLMVISTVLANPAGVIGSAIASSGRMWAGFALNTAWAAVFLVAAMQLATRGAAGLAWAYAISYAVHLALVAGYLFLAGRAGAEFARTPFSAKSKTAEETRLC